MYRLNIILCLLIATFAVVLSQFPRSVAHASNKKCEIVTERTCDLKGNCKDKTYETCSGFSGAPGKAVNPRNASPRPAAKSLSK
jgi:hypothetical protein